MRLQDESYQSTPPAENVTNVVPNNASDPDPEVHTRSRPILNVKRGTCQDEIPLLHLAQSNHNEPKNKGKGRQLIADDIQEVR